jgi:hypothetical protein
MGPRGSLIFIIIGAFAVLYSTLFSATAANARIFTDALWSSGLASVGSHNARKRWIRAFVIATPLLNFVLFVLFGNPAAMVIVGGFAQALTLPLLAAAAIFLRYKRTDPRLAAGKVWDLLLWISFLSFCLVAGYALFDTFKSIKGN